LNKSLKTNEDKPIDANNSRKVKD